MKSSGELTGKMWCWLHNPFPVGVDSFIHGCGESLFGSLLGVLHASQTGLVLAFVFGGFTTMKVGLTPTVRILPFKPESSTFFW